MDSGVYRICWQTADNFGTSVWHVNDRVNLERAAASLASEDPCIRVWLETKDGPMIEFDAVTYALRWLNADTAASVPIVGMERIESFVDMEREAEKLHNSRVGSWLVMVQSSTGLNWVYEKERYGK